MSEVVVKIEDLHKKYTLGSIGGGTLSADLESWWARVRGKEDPNTKIGTKQYGKNETFMALNGINLEINKGDTIGIIGGNGAGKSTLLKILSRVTAPTEGEVKIKGRISSMLEVGTGFHGELTGRENIYLNGAILGMTKAEVDEKIDDIIEFSECSQFIDTPVKRYSSGMYVKLAFSVAAHLDSEILVMDEVLAVGDMKFQQKCLGKMGYVSEKEGKTILYVSHNMNTIRQLCNRCIVLEKGRIKYDGDTETAISIYMNSDKSLEIFNSYKEIHRSDEFELDEKIFLNSIEILNKDIPKYNSKEKLCIELDYDAKVDMKNICVRIPIFYSDKTVVGMSTTQPAIECKCGKNKQKLELDISCLAPGKYIARIVIYSVNQFGTTLNHDVVDDAFCFEVVSDVYEINNLVWEHKYWGYLNFPQIEIC